MPQLLEKAISEIRKLPESDQNAIAAVLMAELAAEALAEYKADRTQPLDPDRAWPLGQPRDFAGPFGIYRSRFVNRQPPLTADIKRTRITPAYA